MSQQVTLEASEKNTKVKTKRTLKDNVRQVKYNLTTIRANLKFVFRAVLREIKYFIPLQDLFILYLSISMIILIFLVILIWGLPLALSFLPGDPFKAWVIPTAPTQEALELLIREAGFKYIHYNLIRWDGWIFNWAIIRWGAGIIGVTTIIVRLMIKSPIMKYRDKINTKKDVTYVFGSSRPAEQFLFEMVKQYGYEEKVSLIADADLLWIRKLKSSIDIYVVEDAREFGKPNLYDIIGFRNASRVMILTESIELNQNILTNIRQVRPEVDIILLSQYAPTFVFSDLVEDEHLIVIEDLDATVQGLVTSLSLDFDYPQTAEIEVPRTFIGYTGNDMTSDIPRLDVLLIRRGDELLPPEMTFQKGDRVIVYYYSNYMMMLANRVATELPLIPKMTRKPKKPKEGKKQDKRISKTQIESAKVEVPTVSDEMTSDINKISSNNLNNDEVN